MCVRIPLCLSAICLAAARAAPPCAGEEGTGESCSVENAALPAEQSAMLQMPRAAAASGGDAEARPVMPLKPEWATKWPPFVALRGAEVAAGEEEALREEAKGSDTEVVEDKRAASVGRKRSSWGPLRLARPTAAEMEHFNLVKALRRQGFTCPDGTYFPPNNGEFLFDCRLFRAGRLWSRRMALENFAAHRKGNSTSCTRTESQGFPKLRGCGENIAAGVRSPRGSLEQLKKSNGHCKNMMEPSFNKLGVGFAMHRNSKFRFHWTDAFGAWHYGPDQTCIGGDPAPAAKPGCEDIDTMNCHFYREQGMCDISPSVKEQCKDTCGIGHCGSQPQPPSEPTCQDTDNHCAFYKGKGYCSWVENVRAGCKRTCDLCGSAPAPAPQPPAQDACQDLDGACAYYHARGYCSTDHIKKHCMKTCGVCGGQPPAPAHTSCSDTPGYSSTCRIYQRKGYCSWVQNVQRHCQKTCNLCRG